MLLRWWWSLDAIISVTRLNSWWQIRINLESFSNIKRDSSISHPPHCCRARVSCPPPWCGASGTGRGGCPWWFPCGWSSQCRPAPSSVERWETARYLLRRTESTATLTKPKHWLQHGAFLLLWWCGVSTEKSSSWAYQQTAWYHQQHSCDWGLVVRKQQEKVFFFLFN